MDIEKRKKVIAGAFIAGAAVLGACAVSAAVTKALIDTAMNKEDNLAAKTLKKGLVMKKDMRPILDKAAVAAEILKNKPSELICIDSFDGLKLYGHFHKVPSPKRLVIAFHGWRSDYSSDFGLIADFYEKNDCDVLYVEQRGQNEAQGEYMGFGLLERFDCVAWANWAEKQNLGLPVYLCGISMGATTVLMASGDKLPACIHGIMADCGFTSPKDIWKSVTEKSLHLIYDGLRELLADDMCKQKLNMKADAYSTLTALKSNTLPVLFIHGSSDGFVPVEMTYKNYIACTSPKRLLIVPGADHGMSYIVEKEKYESTVLEFWHDYD